MKFLKRKFQGAKKVTNEEILQELKNIDISLNDRNFDLLDENSQLKDKIFKKEEENLENKKIIELRERDNKDLIRENKELKKKNNLEMQVSDAVEKIDEVIKLLEEFKGNIYEVKKIKSCTGTKQKSKIKSSNKTSAIIKNVKGEN